MRYSFTLLIVLVLSPLTAIWSAEEQSTKPNIIFLLADDSGFADFGCYGHPYARTPNIDKLAAQGTRFTQFYATGVTCCPTRTGLMTSRWPASYSTYPANGGFGDRVTITELLHKHGYATGHFGKWHIGPEDQAKSGVYGIDVVSSGTGSPKKKNKAGRDAPIYDEAIQFIEQHQNTPFYLNVWGHVSHHKVDPPQSYVDKFKDVVIDESKFSPAMQEKFAVCKAQGGDVSKHMQAYLADIYSLDEDIGRLLKRLDELGLSQNTIVIFSSDQGAAPIRSEENKDSSNKTSSNKASKSKGSGSKDDVDNLRLNAMGYNGIYRGGKHGMYEGGVRVPWIVRWPGHVPANRVDEKSVISGADFLPTLCALTGLTIGVNNFDGEDASTAWLGKTEHVRTKPLLWKTSSIGSEAGIRDGQWKLIYPTRKKATDLALYDILNDPIEQHNLASKHPEIVKTLSAKVEAWVSTLPTEYIKTDDNDR
jgi:arylsulfatase A-like enzyme